MLEKTPFRCPEFSCQKKFTSDSSRLKHIKLHHPEHFQDARQKNQTIRCAPRCVAPAQRRIFNANAVSVKDLDAFPYLEQVENIADPKSQQPQPREPRPGRNPRAGAALMDYIADPWESDAQGCLETNLQNNPYYPFVTCEEYKYIQCWIQKKCMKTYYDNLLKGENIALHCPSFKNRNVVQKLVASMPDNQALGEWELHTLKDMRWNDNHLCPIKYWSRAIIKRMRWLMRQPAYAEHLIHAPQRCFISNTPPKPLYAELHTADWWWEIQVSWHTRG